MKRSIVHIILILVCFAIAVPQTAKQKPSPKKPAAAAKTNVPKTQKDKISYVLGYDVGMKMMADMQNQNLDISSEIFLQAIHDAFEGRKPVLSDSDAQQAMVAFQQMVRAGSEENDRRMKDQLQRLKIEQEQFLSANLKKNGVKVTPSGLQYKVVKEGFGASPKSTSKIVGYYRGKLVDGTIVDEAYDPGQPATLALNQLIPGLTEGLQLMKAGGKTEFYIPNHLAYGTSPAGPKVPPGAMMIFEVELIEVK